MAAHGAHPHTDSVNVNRVLKAAQDFVGLGLCFPLFTALTVGQCTVNPGNQAAGQRHSKMFDWNIIAALGCRNLTVDVQNGCSRVCQLVCHYITQVAHLVQQLAHVLRARTTGCLISHGAHPFDQASLKQSAQPHQHQADCAVAANKGFYPGIKPFIDHLPVNRIQHDNGIILHAQTRGCVNPVTTPAGFTQLGENLVGVVTALAGQDYIQAFQGVDVVGVFQCRCVLANGRALTTHVGGGKKDWFDQVKIPLFQHTLHQHGTNHATPAYKSNSFHLTTPLSMAAGTAASHTSQVIFPYSCCKAATTASPISAVPT